MSKIYLKEFKDNKPKDLNELLKTLYSNKYSAQSSTNTYNDKECNKIHCLSNKNRSIHNLLMLSNTYFDNITEYDLIKELLKLRKKDDIYKYLYFLYCPHVRKHVIYFSPYDCTYSSINLNCRKNCKYYPKPILDEIKKKIK